MRAIRFTVTDATETGGWDEVGNHHLPPNRRKVVLIVSICRDKRTVKYGQILVDGSGRTLYLLTADSGMKSTCYGTCASIWPPDVTTGTPASSGLTASMVGTTARTDHTMQDAYHGHPLYTFTHDTKAGDVNGEGLTTFGGTWYVVGVDGNAITSAPAAPAPSTSGGHKY
ncbi:hypothetical protein [Streptacidiphilus sp. MAP12-20]|uniref:COG4315 family predicted lipoprotein n=1 Tax=Streptacidiphilus sp. MAP12-20 TaxID=3156299 RepID=UPI003513E9BE